MTLWIVLIFFIIVPFPVLVWKRNWKMFLVSILPLIYVVFDVYLECKATGNHSETCVWGYLGYIYAIVAGSAFYLSATLIETVISKIAKNKHNDPTNV